MTPPALVVNRLRKSFGSLVVTDDVDLRVERGERHAIIGPNGAGKSSLINQLGGQLVPSSGQVFLAGVEVTGRHPEQICRLGLARTFQANNLFGSLSVLENVRLAVQVHRGQSRDPSRSVHQLASLRERSEEVLDQLGLLAVASRTVNQLSYGEQRQLEIAVALACEPSVLLLDEPTSGMSPAETQAMIGVIARLPKDLALLMVEHDMHVVRSLATTITVLHYGAVLATGSPQQIMKDARVRDVYLGAKVVY